MEEKEAIKFDASAKMYKKLAERRLDEDDLEGALGFYFAAKKKTKYLLSIYAGIADLYYEMGLYELSVNYWFKVLDLAPKNMLLDAYTGLALCYFYLDNMHAANYYFEKCIEIDDSGIGYMWEEMSECLQRLIEMSRREESAFGAFVDSPAFREPAKIVYPYECVDYSETMRAAKSAMLRGSVREAAEIYSEVQPGSPYYDKAQIEISVAAFLSGDVDRAIELSRAVYDRDKKNIIALCNLSTMYRFKDMNMLADMYFSYIDERNIKDDEDLYKVATTYCENGRHERAVSCFERLEAVRPYNPSVMFFHGVALYNSGRYEESRDMFSRILRISESNPVALYYYRLADNAVTTGAKNAKPVSYHYRLPESEEQANLKKLGALLKTRSQKLARKKSRERETEELMDWCFMHADREIQRGAVYYLSFVDTKAADSYLLDRLIDPSVFDATKEYIIMLFALRGFDKSAGLVSGNVYKRINFYALDLGDDRYADEFIDAYALCFARTAITDGGDLKKLHDAANEVYFANSYTEIFKTADTRDLAAYLYYRAGYEEITTISEIADIFECDKTKLKKLTEQLK